MQIGMIGLGRMGAGMVRRLLRGGHECVVHDVRPEMIASLESDGAFGATSLEGLFQHLRPPRVIWMMLPAAIVDGIVADLEPLLEAGDILVDGGNTRHEHDIRRATRLEPRGIRYLDVGTSGGVWGLEHGYCLMVGGDLEAFRTIEPLLVTLAPGVAAAHRSPGRSGDFAAEEQGYVHCGPTGAGHFVKMVHNGIEYGMMAAFAEGLNLLRNAGAGRESRAKDAETTPLDHPEHYPYEFDLAAITELWRRGSVVRSWLLDLTAAALHGDSGLEGYSGRVSDSGEGRWAIHAAVDVGAPVHVLSAALFDRFESRGRADFANKVLSAMRHGFGGHTEK